MNDRSKDSMLIFKGNENCYLVVITRDKDGKFRYESYTESNQIKAVK